MKKKRSGKVGIHRNLKKDEKKTKYYIINFKHLMIKYKPLVEDLENFNFDDVDMILETIEGDILIDRTYVDYPGNFRTDKFIPNEMFEEYTRLVDSCLLDGKEDKKTMSMIQEMNVYFALMYAYSVLDKYNYTENDLELQIDYVDGEAQTEYYLDTRTDWNI